MTWLKIGGSLKNSSIKHYLDKVTAEIESDVLNTIQICFYAHSPRGNEMFDWK